MEDFADALKMEDVKLIEAGVGEVQGFATV